jgi:hypothetical protein
MLQWFLCSTKPQLKVAWFSVTKLGNQNKYRPTVKMQLTQTQCPQNPCPGPQIHCPRFQWFYHISSLLSHTFKIWNNYIQQSPSWEANSRSSSLETPHIPWNLKAHDSIHKGHHWSLSWAKWFHSITFNLFDIHFNIMLQSCLGIPSNLFISGVLTKTWHTFLIIHVKHMLPPVPPTLISSS